MNQNPVNPQPPPELPGGTVTFLFTDIQGSTQLLKQLGEAYTTLLADHRQILRAAFEKWDGSEIDTQGDAFFASFPRATQAAAAVVEIQRALSAHDWPSGVEVRVRMGLHTGEPWLVEEGYVGMDVHRAARIAHVGHGGQVLLSETTAALVLDELPQGVSLVDLGRHLLKDIHRPEHIRQLVIAELPSEYPQLTSLEVLPPTELREPRPMGECPYLGLSAFREADAEFFYGRESFSERLVEAVHRQPLVAVIVGSSGSGKSSVVCAGLLPRLREEGGWLIAQLRPGGQPFRALAGALLPLLETELDETRLLIRTREQADALSEGKLPLADILERVRAKSDGARRLLLVVDQFEELYTLCPDADLRRRFKDELLAAVGAGSATREPAFVLLLTMRADFMGQALAHRPFADALQEASLLMGPMTRDELREAVEKPAEMQGAVFEPGLVERILDDVGEEPGNLPLLEFALTLLWEGQSDGWLTHTDYEDIGCVEGALAHYADEVYADLDEDEREGAHRVFVQLVRPGEGTEDTRRLATRAELGDENWDLVQQLADKRLVVTGRDAAGNESVEVVHEALIQKWGQLQGWMSADRAFRTWQERLRTSLRGWEGSQRDEGALLRGLPLAEAEEWLGSRVGELSAVEVTYIQESVALQERRTEERERRRRRTILALAGGLVVALILALLAGQQWRRADDAGDLAVSRQYAAETAQAQEGAQRGTAEAERTRAEGQAEARATQQAVAESERARAEGETQARATLQAVAEERARVAFARNLAVIASDNLITDPQLGMLLALQAANQTYSVDGTLLPESETVLHQAIRHASRLQFTIPAQDDSRPYVSFSPDGARLIAHYFPSGEDPLTLPDHTVTRIWEASTGDLLHTLPAGAVAPQWPPGDQVAMLEFTDGNELWVNFWNTSDGMQLSTSILNVPANLTIDQINSLVLNLDLSVMAISWAFGGSYGVWDLQTGENELIISHTALDPSWGRVGWNRVLGGVYLHSTLPTLLMFSTDGKRLISLQIVSGGSGTYSGAIRSEDWETGEMLFAKSISGLVDRFISPSQDGEWMAKPYEGYIVIQEFESLEDLAMLLSPQAAIFSAMTFSPDGSLFAAASPEGIIYIWDLKASISSNSSQLLLALSDPVKDVYDLDFSPDGTRLSSVAADGSIKVWDIRPNGGAELPAIGKPSISEGNQQISMALSPDGHQLAIARPGEGPTIWDPETRKPLFDLLGEAGSIEDISYSPDGGMIATCNHAGPLILWDAENGRQLLRLDGYTEAGCALDFHPDGNSLALGFYKNTVGWYQVLELPDLGQDSPDPIDLKLPFPWRGVHDGETTEMAFNPNGNQLAGTTSIGEFYLWDPWLENPESFEGLYTVIDQSILLQESLNYQDVAFNPEGNQLITTGIDGTVTIWDTEALTATLTIPAHNGKVTTAAFSPDGREVATGSTDRSIKIWDVYTGQSLLTLFGHTDTVTGMAFSPDGSRLYAAGADGRVQVYLMDIDELVELAKSGLTRSLTQGECQTYLNLDVCPKE